MQPFPLSGFKVEESTVREVTHEPSAAERTQGVRLKIPVVIATIGLHPPSGGFTLSLLVVDPVVRGAGRTSVSSAFGTRSFTS